MNIKQLPYQNTKQAFAIGGLVLAVLVLGCSNDREAGDSVNLSSKALVSLNYKECLEMSHVGSKICLDSVINDSRCPTGLDCVWEGDGIVRFSMEKNDKIEFFKLHTHANFQRDTIINGLKISLKNLSPYPAMDSQISQEEYSVEITISEE